MKRKITCETTGSVDLISISFCIIRYLYDRGLLNNITLERDPRNIESDKCNSALDYVKGKTMSQLNTQIKNCTIKEEKEVMTHLEDLVILTRVLAKLKKIVEVKEVRVEINDTIEQKCNGMQKEDF